MFHDILSSEHSRAYLSFPRRWIMKANKSILVIPKFRNTIFSIELIPYVTLRNKLSDPHLPNATYQNKIKYLHFTKFEKECIILDVFYKLHNSNTLTHRYARFITEKLKLYCIYVYSFVEHLF